MARLTLTLLLTLLGTPAFAIDGLVSIDSEGMVKFVADQPPTHAVILADEGSISLSTTHPSEWEVVKAEFYRTAEVVRAARDALKHLTESELVETVPAIYTSPTAKLRQEADRIDARDAAIRRLREALNKLEPIE